MNTPPQSANITPGPIWALLSPIGRMGREPYWLSFALVWIIIGIAIRLWWISSLVEITPETVSPAAFAESNALFPILFFVLQWFELALVIKRLQDIGQSGFLALLIFVPILNVLMVVFLGFVPSQSDANRHGPLPNSYWRKS
ncbi:DUF805 domain-containing protein [Roseibium porphyridii]|uniref:DUF805 domain-containing protein n=1 Tax=Roseibium porphyridii TaxID=2866279 RepID=A0ABY8F181_9HYPH|nr:DUF805 domain-containing protein [Roseibium sp. KMA01]WFE89200.1 DUF805 domain-containing protein [Roseibium sp. KMA01]